MRLLGVQGVDSITLTRRSRTKNYTRYELIKEDGKPFGMFFLPNVQAKNVETVTVIVNKDHHGRE